MRMTHPNRAIAIPLLSLLVAACELHGPSRVAQGQLYYAGSPTYDAFFRDVHQQQVDAAGWDDDRRNAHRSLVSALELTPDAADVTIVQATHEAASKTAKQPGSVRLDVDGTNAHVVASGGADASGALFRAVEDTARQELERAKRLHGLEPRIDAMSRTGGDLSGRAKADFASRGVGKETEVETELSASLDVLRKLKSRAESDARESEDFVADLERALETASEDRAAKTRDRHKKRDHGDKDKDHEDTKPAPKPAPASDQAAAAPKPAPPAPPPPKPADTGEVFTP